MNNTATLRQQSPPRLLTAWLIGLALAAAAWFAIYWHLIDFADFVVAAFGLDRGTHIGAEVHFLSAWLPLAS